MRPRFSFRLLRCFNQRKYRRMAMSCLTIALLHATHQAQAQHIELPSRDYQLADLLEVLEKKSSYKFFYNKKHIAGRKVSLKKSNSTVLEVLDQALTAVGLSYEIKDSEIVISQSTRKPTVSGKQEQQQLFKGSVLDNQGRPLKGVTVRKLDTGEATVSDEQGNFYVQGAAPMYVSMSMLGYDPLNRELHTGVSNAIVLHLTNSELEEVVVVGYRAVKREQVNGSVAVVNMSEKEKQTITHPSQALYGTSGVWINQAGAKPGNDGATIRIRGVNTLNNSNPLVLLDGIEYSLNEIDPADIESITVLKDASAAIYGSRSSNGVILVTSKKGHAGKTKIDFRAHSGLQQASFLPDVVDDPILYMEMRNRAEANSGKTALSYSQEQIDEYRNGLGTDPSVYPASNWFDIALDNGILQQYNARVSGGNNQINFTVGAGYMDQQGIFIANDDAKRYSFDVKVSAQATARLKLNAGFIGNLREFNEVGYGTSTVMGVIMRALPIMSDYRKGNVYGSTWLYTPGRNNIENPRMEVEQGFTIRDYQETLTNFAIEYKLPFDITYYNSLGYRRIDHFSKDFIPQMYTVDPKTGDLRNFNGSAPRVKDWDSLDKQFTLSHRLVFERQRGEHNLHAMLGQDYQINDGRNFQAYNWGFYDNSLVELNALSDQTNAQATGGSAVSKLASVYSRLAYDYQGKYSIEGSLRYDGSSRFAPGNQWSFFPSVAAGWTISKERFFAAVPSVNFLKLRATVGKLGNQAVGIGVYNSTFNINSNYNYSFGGTTVGGAAIAALTDRDIRWESTLSYNAGLDMRIWNKWNITADYFYKRTFDILRAVSIPSQVGGLTGPTVNLGKVDNKGWEIGSSFQDNMGDFSYALNGSVSYVKNKVVDIAGQQVISGRYIIKEGYPINSYFLYQADGYYQTQEEIDRADAVYGTRSKVRPGYINYANQNGDNYIDDADKIVTGSSIPTWTYGFGLQLGYRGLHLDAQFQGVADVDVYPTGNVAFPFNNGANVTYEWARESWTPSNPNAALPLLTTTTDAGENFINSTFWLQDASYLRMKNISLAYDLPSNWLKALGIGKMSVYVSGQNLLTVSKFTMWDPELTTSKGDLYEYPNLKSYSAGLNLNF